MSMQWGGVPIYRARGCGHSDEDEPTEMKRARLGEGSSRRPGFDESDLGGEAFGGEADEIAFAVEGGVLGDGDFEIGDEAGFVAVLGDLKGSPGGSKRGLFR